MKFRMEFLLVAAALAAVLAAPWILRPKNRFDAKDAEDTLVIITPHSESIREEFTEAFTNYYTGKTGRSIRIDWRIPGGTTEIAMVIRGGYRAAFEYEWTKRLNRPWTDQTGEFWDPKAPVTEGSPRHVFLASNVGIGMDLFFGGGAYDFIAQANAGALVADTTDGLYGLKPLSDEHPGWFAPDAYPPELSGEVLRDPDWRWAGVCLSGFGIVSNLDVCQRLGFQKPPSVWADLANPKFNRQVALADPTKSGSAAKAFEMLIQECMAREMKVAGGVPSAKVLETGWDAGMRLILRISANSRYFTDSATKVPHDVAAGEAACGMCIDFYGRTFNEMKKGSDGVSRVAFVMPRSGTSLGADPIAMFRGAPHPVAAHLFMEFVFSNEGQQLWCQRPGTPGGPKKIALRRVPIRRDVFEASTALLSDADANAWEQAPNFTYHPEWTDSTFGALRFIVRVACVDTHEEQRAAWEALIRNGFPEQAAAEFESVVGIGLNDAKGRISQVLKSKDRIQEVILAREYALRFRNQYQKAQKLAEQKL